MGESKYDIWDVLMRHGGKLIGACVLLVLGSIALLRAKPSDVPKVFGAIFSSDTTCWVGWLVALLIFIFSVVLVTILLKIYPAEMKRIARERDKYQEMVLGKPVQHSEIE